jgi:FG-GAP-like repeat
MSLWRPQGGSAARPQARRLAFRPRLQPLEDRSLPSTTAVPTPDDPNAPPPPPDPPPSAPPPIVRAPALYAVGADLNNKPVVQVFDTSDGSMKYDFLAYDASVRGGVRVATGDINGDGVDDIVTAPGPGTAPLVKVFDGATGQQLAQFMAYDAGLRGGVYVAVADVNGDGHADIVTGAGEGGGPHVKAFNGAWAVPPIGQTDPAQPPADTATVLLQSFMAYDPGFRGGVRVAAGDVNGDGHADIVTGAGSGGGPHVQVFSGTTGQQLVSFMAFASAYTGGVYVTAGDIDGDGKAELAVGAGLFGSTLVKVYDDNGAPLRTFVAENAKSPLPVRVGMVDVDQDGKADLITAVGTLVQVRNPTNNAVKQTVTSLDPTVLAGVFVG